MKLAQLLVVSLAVLMFAGCSKHDCSLETEADKQAFGQLADATSGANSCFVSNGELVATHGGSDVAGTAEQYKKALEGKGFTVEVKDHTGERMNGKKLEGKAMRVTKGDKQTHILIYQLGDEVIEAVVGPLE